VKRISYALKITGQCTVDTCTKATLFTAQLSDQVIKMVAFNPNI